MWCQSLIGQHSHDRCFTNNFGVIDKLQRWRWPAFEYNVGTGHAIPSYLPPFSILQYFLYNNDNNHIKYVFFLWINMYTVTHIIHQTDLNIEKKTDQEDILWEREFKFYEVVKKYSFVALENCRTYSSKLFLISYMKKTYTVPWIPHQPITLHYNWRSVFGWLLTHH